MCLSWCFASDSIKTKFRPYGSAVASVHDIHAAAYYTQECGVAALPY